MESVISKIHQLWGSPFSWKYSKFNVDLKNGEKNWEQVFCFWDNFIGIGCFKLSLLRREYLSWAINVLTKSLKTLHMIKRDFYNSIALKVVNNLLKLMSFRFQQCLVAFTMWLVEGSSGARLFKHSFHNVFRSP